MIMALLLDLANIVGGLLLALPLLQRLPRAGQVLQPVGGPVARYGWIVGVVALVASGFYLLVHATAGPHLFHFELVGAGVGIALLWERLTSRPEPPAGTAPATVRLRGAEGPALLLAIFGLIAIVVGIQGLFTPDS